MRPRVADVLSRIVLLAGAVAAVATDCPQPLCDDDEECRASCEWELARAARLDAEAAEAPPPALSAADCSLRQRSFPDGDVSERPHCHCEDAQGASYDLWGGDGHCLVVARNARCLLWATDYSRDLCVPGDPTSCAEVCADLEARLIADALRPVGRQLVDADCEFQCTCVVDIEGACAHYPQGFLDGIGPVREDPCP